MKLLAMLYFLGGKRNTVGNVKLENSSVDLISENMTDFQTNDCNYPLCKLRAIVIHDNHVDMKIFWQPFNEK